MQNYIESVLLKNMTESLLKSKEEKVLNTQSKYDTMPKNELIQLCMDKDLIIDKCIHSLKSQQATMLSKKEIMEIYHCESNKALRILKLMFQMGYGNKIGKEYYISRESQDEFIKSMLGKEVFI